MRRKLINKKILFLVIFVLLVFAAGVIIGIKISPKEAQQTIPLQKLEGINDCGKSNKVIIYAMHSPTSAVSAYQRDVMEEIKKEFKDAVDIRYICTPLNIHLEDVDNCIKFTTLYPQKWNIDFNESQKLLKQYAPMLGQENFTYVIQNDVISLTVAPLLIFNCNQVRVGSLTLMERMEELPKDTEKHQIEKEICNLLKEKPLLCNFLSIRF
jgi:hypothetical protein